jgi:hypothetical protein
MCREIQNLLNYIDTLREDLKIHLNTTLCYFDAFHPAKKVLEVFTILNSYIENENIKKINNLHIFKEKGYVT